MYRIYILKLTNDKYFIGRTKTIKETIENHFNGIESQYTKEYKPLFIVSIIDEIQSIYINMQIINIIKNMYINLV
jgi:predicted GIY-YIG superfamily endonuclease